MGTILADGSNRQRDLVKAVFQDGVHAAIRGDHSLGLVALGQTHQSQACPIAMLGVWARAQDRVDQLGHRRPDARTPGHQLGWRPFQMRGVLRLGDEAFATVAAHMAGRAPAAMKELNDVGRGAHFDRLTRQLVRHRVVTRVELYVVIDVHPNVAEEQVQQQR
jgi:hypothetical protein